MATGTSSSRVRVDGKFFRLGEKKFDPKGVTYGPFAPNAAGERYAERGQTLKDFAQIKELGANTLRVYHVPPHWFLDLAQEQGLKVLDYFASCIDGGDGNREFFVLAEPGESTPRKKA